MVMKTINLLLFVFVISLTASAQKLPNVQETSLRAPTAIKVDDKPTEWNNQFQAYNKTTEIFYTISNDDDKLYLTVQATDLDVINKILEGGVSLRINGLGKMKDQGGKVITYPVIVKEKFRQTIDIDKPDDWTADSCQ
ncbi:MAG TPA: hypothetical protein DIT07_14330 [Sphingobacteriaceae bacterium]|nr:hypothetical protein [Sphingobacteriaceae bacterium]